MDLNKTPLFKFFGLLLLFTGISVAALGQGTQTQFGKNRVQYKDFTWSYFTSDHFVTYFYLGGQDIGKFTIQAAEAILPDIENKLEYKVENKLEILVYNSLSDLQQTNIGIGITDFNTGGETKIIGNKIFIYFDGNHEHLVKQIREGIARIFINDMLYGGNVQEVLQNAVLLNLPEWFVEGIVSYVGEDWSTDMDNKLKDGILTGKYRKFNKLSGDDAKFAGHAIWYYISLKYGESAVPNLLYLTRINRSLESGFLFVIGKTFNQSINEWYYYFFNKYTDEEKLRTLPEEEHWTGKKTRKSRDYNNLRITNDGKKIAYVSRSMGQFKIHIFDLETGKTKTILKGGFRTVGLPTEQHYPLIDWNPVGNKLAIMYEKGNKTKLVVYNHEDGKKTKALVTKFQNVLDMSFMDGRSRSLLLSAVNRGQSDIYTYHIESTRSEQLTNDFYDDLQPRYVDAGHKQGVMFISNRNGTSLENLKLDTLVDMDNFDVYFFDYTNRTNELIRVTNTPGIIESMPMDYQGHHFSYLSDQNGINNRFIGYLDSTLAHYDTIIYYRDTVVNKPDKADSLIRADRNKIDSVQHIPVYKPIAITYPTTNFASNILEQDVAMRNGKTAELFLYGGRFQFYVHPIKVLADSVTPPFLINSSYRNRELTKASIKQSKQQPTPAPKEAPVPKEQPKKEEPDDGKIDIENYFFQSEFNQIDAPKKEDPDKSNDTGNNEPNIDPIPKPAATPPDQPEKEPVFRRSRVLPYQVKFATDNVVTQIDNSILFGNYQSLSTGRPEIGFPSLSPFIRASVSDLFEDYRLTGGVRVPFGFNGTEYFMSYHNLKRRLDKKFLYYRKVKRGEINGNSFKEKNNIGLVTLSYPLDVVRSIRGHFMYRHDKFVPMATDTFTLNFPTYFENWFSYKMEYVYDNTLEKSMNILNGTRYKVYAEVHKQFEVPYFKNDEIFQVETGYFSTLGVDFRHYQKLHKQITLATRVAASTSFGSRKLVYMLGGVDSWYGTNLFEEGNNFAQNVDYSYASYATNLRGFRYNVRNGSNYALINNELRVPVFQYLISKPIRSKFIENFQVVGFYDFGTAWEGRSPYEQDNPFNTDEIQRGPVKITVNYFRNPFVSGYGFGMRSLVFGYFMRLDFAWGREDGAKQAPITYFSLSLDF